MNVLNERRETRKRRKEIGSKNKHQATLMLMDLLTDGCNEEYNYLDSFTSLKVIAKPQK